MIKKIKQCKCKHCKQNNPLSVLQRICAPHLFHKWYLRRCRHCGKISWLKYTKGETNEK